MNTRFAAIMLALLISGYLAGQTSPQIKKTPVQKTSPASGLEMYTQYCAPCHGKDGKGKRSGCGCPQDRAHRSYGAHCQEQRRLSGLPNRPGDRRQ